MKPIGYYLDVCLPVSEEHFVRQCKSAFLLHSVAKGGEFTPVSDSRKDTFNRMSIPDEQTDRDPLSSVSFRVFEVQISSPHGRLSVGSSSRCDLQINDSSISRNQAYIFLEDGTYSISDNNSTFGTTVNGELLGLNEIREITNGDRVGMGKIGLIFLYSEAFHRLVCGLFER